MPDPLDREGLCAIEHVGQRLIERDDGELLRPDVLRETVGVMLDATTGGRKVGGQDGDAQSSGPSRNVRQEMARLRGRQARTQGARVLVEYVGDRGRSMAVP